MRGLPVPGGTETKRGICMACSPAMASGPFAWGQPGPARPLEAPPIAEMWGGPCISPTRDMGQKTPKQKQESPNSSAPAKPLLSTTQEPFRGQGWKPG